MVSSTSRVSLYGPRVLPFAMACTRLCLRRPTDGLQLALKLGCALVGLEPALVMLVRLGFPERRTVFALALHQPEREPERKRRDADCYQQGHPCLTALSPVSRCHRSTMTSQYAGEISSATLTRSRCSAATTVVPEPQNGSYTTAPLAPWLRIGRAMHSRGFCVAWPVTGLSSVPRAPPIRCRDLMFQVVDCLRSPDHLTGPPSRAAYQQGSCCQW